MLVVKNLCKNFRLYKKPSDRIVEVFFRKSKHEIFVALSKLSFSLKHGQSLGVIGPNGAGKSTLMKILTGLLIPDEGSVSIDGHITGLIELGTGFNQELSGRENIRNNALLLGMSSKQFESVLSEIISFAEIGSYINEPLKIYSSGMVMRLAFAIAIHSKPKCFIIDEALSVGDAYFQQKCTRKIMEFRENGGSLILVSHDMNAIKLLCDKVLVLNKGRCFAIDDPEPAVNCYNKILAGMQKSITLDAPTSESGYGTLRAEILHYSLNGIKLNSYELTSGAFVSLKLSILARCSIDDLVVGFLIRDRFGQDVFGTNTFLDNVQIPVTEGDKFDVTWKFILNLGLGKYTITVAIHRGPDHTQECLHWSDAICGFEVTELDGKQFIGLCRLEPSLTIKKVKSS